MNSRPTILASGVLRMTPEEFEALPRGMPKRLDPADIGARWLEAPWGSLLVKEWRGFGPDGRLFETYRPIIRVKAISRLVPRRAIQ